MPRSAIQETPGSVAERERAPTRARARARARSGNREEREEVGVASSDTSFDEEDKGKTLHAKDGMLGFVTDKGFISATNFVVDIEAQVYSEKYSMKGNCNKFSCV